MQLSRPPVAFREAQKTAPGAGALPTGSGESQCVGIPKRHSTCSRIFIGFYEIFSTDAGLTANCPQRRAFDVPVIWQGQRRAGAIGILANHRNVFALLNQFKTQDAQRGQNIGLGSVHWKFHKLNRRFGNIGIQRGTFGFQRFAAKCGNVETDGALDIVQGFIKRISFPDDHARYADRIRHITIGMFFNDDFHANNMPLREERFKVTKGFFCEKPRPGNARAGLRKLTQFISGGGTGAARRHRERRGPACRAPEQ